MNKKDLILIFMVAFLATILRFYINNNLISSILGSFFFGVVVSRRFKKSTNIILLSGFCSCFTSFSGFIFFLYELINQEDFIKFFVFLNLSLILNLLTMYFGFLVSRKFN